MAEEDSVSSINLYSMAWQYRGEGNANLVITLSEAKVILRFEKCDYGVQNPTELETLSEKKLKKNVMFYKTVIAPFMGKIFMQPPKLALLRREEITRLDQELLNQRPSYRLSKGICFPMATIHPDYTYLPPSLYFKLENNPELDKTYCIEIKPKQGWVFPGDRRHPKCTYCLNQYLKLWKKRVGRISGYCPLDLFSGIRARMKKALKNLLITPQNNLKIFEDGKLIYSDDCNGNYITILKDWLEPHKTDEQLNYDRIVDKWCDLLTEALLREFSPEQTYAFNSCEISENNNSALEPSSLAGIVDPCDWNKNALPENSVLNRILAMQTLQNKPFSLLYSIYCQRKHIEGDYDYVDNLLQATNPPGPVERYLLSATAKDCSIFISFKRARLQGTQMHHYIQDCDGESFYMNIGISDIDPKPLSCIEKHYRRDREVLETVKQYIESNT